MSGDAPGETLDDLVVANHILYAEGVVDGFGHVSTRHPERPDRFLLARSMAPALVAAGDIMEFDLDGNATRRRRANAIRRALHPRRDLQEPGAT